MAKAVLDGQMVNIPSLLSYSMEGRRVVAWATYWIVVHMSRREDRKIRSPYTVRHGSCEGSPERSHVSTLPRKASKISMREPVP